ncbi:helix-turn-helix domain-containing protein [Labilibacter marinus]|uniref:hypothetical protein n=1 Tax=Labilibacter marinus TaxID=1477105 RepID=UPI00095035C3|nr:hypothetical protein [Labilibacter marinus]
MDRILIYNILNKSRSVILLIIYIVLSSNSTIQQANDSTHTHLHKIIELSDLDLREGRFNQSFDTLRSALPIATEKSDTSAILKIHRQLGILYGKFGQDSLANIQMQKGLFIAKKYFKKDSSSLLTSYLSLASLYADIAPYDQALLYLDSCITVLPSSRNANYINSLYGKVYINKGEFNKAQKYYSQLEKNLSKTNKNFQVTNYFYLGELHLGLKQPQKAKQHYNTSLSIIDSFGVHPMLKPQVLEKLAMLSHSTGAKKDAYIYMKEAKQASDSMFNIRSITNKSLFELKNKYNEDLQQKDKKIHDQERIIELKDKASNRMQWLISILLLSAGILFIYIRQRFKMKHILYAQQLNKEKNKDILEIKNKELAVNALQFIEKENTINELLEAIKASDTKKHKKLNFKYKQNSKSLWDDFHSRFTQINDKFYKNLLALEPSFTPTELKHCALIKLNFDSKEMAQILGVAHNTIHMSRSRIRKKLNLSREDSLSNYISEI